MDKLIILSAILAMTGCSTVKETFSETAYVVKDNLSRAGHHGTQPTQELSDSELIAYLRNQTKGKTAVPQGQKDGVFSTTSSQGITLKSVAKDGYLDEYVDTYYPNGQLQSHTTLVNGVPHGWSAGYRMDGTMMSRALYQNGKITTAERYDSSGKLYKTLDVQ